MKKLIFACLTITIIFAGEKGGIYDYFHKNGDIPRADGTTFRENLSPSFDCSKESNEESRIAEGAICNNAYYSLIVSDDIKYIYPTFIYLDNLFSSYYKLIMQHTPKDKKQEVKKIAREAMKQREAISNCEEALSSAAIQLCSQQTIADAYESGIQELSKYLSINNPKLLDSIFSQYAKEVGNIEVNGYLRAEILDKLYIDKIIDETGKLIIKVDSK